MRNTTGWIAAGVVIALSIGAMSWWRSERASDHVAAAPDVAPAPDALPSKTAAAGAAASPVLVIGEYRPDTAGLPPTEAPFSAQLPALRAAAARGNATAACRLAVIGSQCAIARTYRWAEAQPQSDAVLRQIEEQLRDPREPVSLDQLPERYRAHAQRRLEAEALSEHDNLERLRVWGQRCADAPPVSQEETMAALRQAALAGEPDSMVRYASGLWTIEFAVGNLMQGFAGRGQGMAWLRSQGFDQWRREAPMVRHAGLERGDPEMLWMAFSFADSTLLTPLERDDPIERAAALRAYAALIGGHSPESTASLGLAPVEAGQADRLSDAWATRARERGRNANDVIDGLMANGVSACD